MALTPSLADTPSGTRNARLRRLRGLSARTAAPASLRKSVVEKVLDLPPPTSSRRLALSPAGACSQVVSKFLAVTSPEETIALAACKTTLSEVETNKSVFSFSPRSRTTATRHSVSTAAGEERESVIFIGEEIVWKAPSELRKGKQDQSFLSFSESRLVTIPKVPQIAPQTEPRSPKLHIRCCEVL